MHRLKQFKVFKSHYVPIAKWHDMVGLLFFFKNITGTTAVFVIISTLNVPEFCICCAKWVFQFTWSQSRKELLKLKRAYVHKRQKWRAVIGPHDHSEGVMGGAEVPTWSMVVVGGCTRRHHFVGNLGGAGECVGQRFQRKESEKKVKERQVKNRKWVERRMTTRVHQEETGQ